MKRILKIAGNIIGILILVVVCFAVMAYYSLQLPEVQTTITQKATAWLSEKLGGTVTVSQAKISWLDEITFEDVNIKDLKGRDMIYVRELYINCKSNFSFDPKKIIKFDNNLDYVLFKNPEVKIVKEKDGRLNIDDWIAKVQDMGRDPNKPRVADRNIPFTIDNAYIKNGFVSLEDNRKKRLPENQFDYYNFRFDNINSNFENVLILGDTVSFKAKSLNAQENRSKLNIKEIKTDFLYCKTAMTLDNLSAYINDSYIGNKLHLYYEKPSAFNDFFDKVNLNANIKNSVFDAQDMGRFSSIMYNYKERYTLNATMSGKYVDLTFKDFDLRFGKSSVLKGTANFKGFPDLRKTNTNLALNASKIYWQDLEQYSNNETYQKYIRKIESLSLEGNYKGFYNDFSAKSILNSPKLGKVNSDIKVKLFENSTLSNYEGDFDIQQLDLKNLLDQNTFGKITFDGKLKGSGFNVNDAKLQLDGEVLNLEYSNYQYQNILVDGSLGQSVFEGKIDIADPNLTAQVEGKADFNEILNSFKINGKIENANLKYLGFTNDNFKIKSNIDFDFIGNKLDDWIGKARLLNTNITKDDEMFSVDSMYFNSALTNDQRRFSFVTEFFNFYVHGNFVPSVLINDAGTLVKEYMMYFNETESNRSNYYKNKKSEFAPNYEADYKFYFKDSKRLFGFFYPDISVSSGSQLNGKFTSRKTKEMTLEGVIDTLSFKDNYFYKNLIDFNTSKYSAGSQVLTSYIIKSENQKLANGLLTQNLNCNAYWGNSNDIDFDLSIQQDANNSFAQIFGNVSFTPEGFNIKLNPYNSKLVLIDNPWTISENNLIHVFKDKISISDLRLTNNKQSLGIKGVLAKDPHPESVLLVSDFDLMTLKPFINVELKGIANGELRLRDFYKNSYFTSNLHIENLEYRKSEIGTLTTEAIWDAVDDKLKVKGDIFRKFQEVAKVEGYYDPKNKTNPLNLTGKIRGLKLQIFEGMVEGVFNNVRGTAEGDVKITGSPLDPVFNGIVNIEGGSINIIASGTSLYFDDKIILNEEGFVAPPEGITVRDAPTGGNTATIQGGIYNGGSGEFMVGLHSYIKSPNGFKVLNIKPFENEVMYGTAYANGDVHVSGDFDNVIISGNLTSNRNTKITIPMDGSKQIDTQKEGIPFIGKKPTIDSSTILTKNKKTTKIKNGGISMAFNLSFTPEAECEIIFDRTNNDILDVFGEGRLSIFYDTRGDFSIYGPYVVRNGKYNFSFQNLASLRRFNIVDGSRITWAGDPYDANLDLKANYVANIPIPSSISRDLANTAVRYPVNVSVLLSNRLMTPTIKYDINFDLKQIPIAGQTELLGFEQKLRNDEQLLSRNVSSILVFNEVFPENLTDAISQQFLIDNVSNLLSNQIGNLANKLNPNLELGVQFGDFRENILNNMQFNFSYKFLDNRVKLSGKSAFINSLENSINAGNVGQLSVGGELEYLLSSDGGYKFRIFSRSVPTNFYTFNSAGNVVVSGGSLIISRSFNSFFSNKKSKAFPLGVGKKEDISMLDSNYIKRVNIQ